jgi:23S rRNA U2552 (ribose-2'-O)-methylase RlmE/FtsJ
MAPSARNLASRLGIDQIRAARAAYLAADSARYFLRGLRFGRHIPPPDVPVPIAPESTGGFAGFFDAHTEGPGVFKWRHYLEIYDRHLSRFRGQPVTLVEVGVAGGGSMSLWRDYLGPESRIYGVDVDPACKRFQADGIEIVIGDQGDPAFWATFRNRLPAFDIVIDDGGHLPHQQVVTLESLLPHIVSGGVYMCEDIHGPFQPFHSFVDGLTRRISGIAAADEPSATSTLQQHIGSVHHYPILTVIEKPAWVAAAFEPHRRGTEWPEDFRESDLQRANSGHRSH